MNEIGGLRKRIGLIRVQSMSPVGLDNSALNKRVAELSVIEAECRDPWTPRADFNEAQERYEACSHHVSKNCSSWDSHQDRSRLRQE